MSKKVMMKGSKPASKPTMVGKGGKSIFKGAADSMKGAKHITIFRGGR